MKPLRAIVLISTLIGAGCAGTEVADPRPVAMDPVCLHDRDLGCVRVRVDEHTPSVTYRGTTYYFCSERCAERFRKDPATYVPRDPPS
jgi:YHS domain-containing protein